MYHFIYFFFFCESTAKMKCALCVTFIQLKDFYLGLCEIAFRLNTSHFFGKGGVDLGRCVIHTRLDATFPNCPLWSPRATELSYYNGDEWEATGEKRQKGGSCYSNQIINSTPIPLFAPFSLKNTPQKTETHSPGNGSDLILKIFLSCLSF